MVFSLLKISKLLNKTIIILIIVLVITLGISAFSIYLQQDDAIETVKKVVIPHYKCLELWDSYKMNPKNDKYWDEFVDRDCSFFTPEWITEDHPDYVSRMNAHKNFINTCTRYVEGEQISEFSIKALKLEKCDEFLKNYGGT